MVVAGIAGVVLLCLALLPWPRRVSAPTPEKLGEALYEALRYEDESAFVSTCGTYEDFRQRRLSRYAPAERENAEPASREWEEDFLLLQDGSRDAYRENQEAARRAGIDWEHTTLDRVTGAVPGLPRFNRMTIYFKSTDHPGALFAISMDDGQKVGERWLFTDQMLKAVHVVGPAELPLTTGATGESANTRQSYEDKKADLLDRLGRFLDAINKGDVAEFHRFCAYHYLRSNGLGESAPGPKLTKEFVRSLSKSPFEEVSEMQVLRCRFVGPMENTVFLLLLRDSQEMDDGTVVENTLSVVFKRYRDGYRVLKLARDKRYVTWNGGSKAARSRSGDEEDIL